MDSEDAVMRDFLDGELTYLSAIIRLEQLGLDGKDAERLVCEWEDGVGQEPRG